MGSDRGVGGPFFSFFFFFFFFVLSSFYLSYSHPGSLSGQQPSVPSWVPGASTQEATIIANPPAAPPRQEANPTASSNPTTQDETDLSLPMSGLAPIPAQLVQAIKAGKYVDLDELLPESLREGFFERPMAKNKEEPKRTRFHITNPVEWAIAFSNYMAVVVHFSPERAFALAAYQGIILSLARDVRGNSWWRYDKVFRQLAAVNPNLSWHRRETDVWLATATGSDGSMLPSTRPPAAHDLPPASRSSPGVAICRSWNQGRCKFPNCRYRHVCLSCRAAGHTSRACPLGKDGQQGTQPGQGHRPQ